MAKNEKQEKAEELEKKKSPVMLIMIIIVAALIIGGGGAFTFLMLKGEGEGDKPKEFKESKGDLVKPIILGKIVPLESFIVNLADSGGKNYLKVDISLELSDAKLEDEINNKEPQIRDAILLMLSTKTFEIIKTSEGKLVLKNELLMRLNSFLSTGVIKNIYFTSFVVQ